MTKLKTQKATGWILSHLSSGPIISVQALSYKSALRRRYLAALLAETERGGVCVCVCYTRQGRKQLTFVAKNRTVGSLFLKLRELHQQSFIH